MQDSTVLLMRKTLDVSFGPPVWPEGVYLTALTPDAAAEVHALLDMAYRGGEGTVAPFSEWWDGLRSDAEFDPSLSFLARDSGGIVGVLHCWTSGFVKDLAVHPRRRSQGIAVSLLLHAFSVFKERGAKAVDLKVFERNKPAVRLYLRLGMEVVTAAGA